MWQRCTMYNVQWCTICKIPKGKTKRSHLRLALFLTRILIYCLSPTHCRPKMWRKRPHIIIIIANSVRLMVTGIDMKMKSRWMTNACVCVLKVSCIWLNFHLKINSMVPLREIQYYLFPRKQKFSHEFFFHLQIFHSLRFPSKKLPNESNERKW